MSSGEKTRVTVNIFGTEYRLMGDANTEPAYLQMVASMVDEQMKKIAENNPRLDLPRIAVLSAVNLADDMSRMRKEHELAQQMEQKRMEQMEREVEQLRSEKTGLEQELKWQQQQNDQLKRQLEHLQQELDELKKKSAEQKPDDEIYEKYAQLQKEYKKLQTEYNEWIELVEKSE